MTRFLCIACEVFARPIYLSAAFSTHVVDVELIQRGLHNQPDKLQAGIQDHIDHAEGRGYQAILLGYGLCGNGTAGLHARSIKLVLPRLHDCIALLLGDPLRYQEQFDQNPGTYWYSQDFLERTDDINTFTTMGPISDTELAKKYEVFLEKYGKENADYLMEVMGAWQTHYKRAAFIDMGLANVDKSKKRVQLGAKHRGWMFETLVGDLVLFRQLLNGEWSQNDASNFIVVPPNHSVGLTYDECIFRCDPL
ncbi:MAG: hypothetical protein FD147_1654 [Chloroflexi bacterium]|nr:MAG: hypothetical protein FD147_1654 [Chloroflexota bacterium]MBA4375625.1 hypothetical protein [Anaerolinea sp.]